MEVACGIKPKIMEDKVNKVASSTDFIPDIVEEHTRDSDGKVVTTKYIRGKLLGKVDFSFLRLLSSFIF